MAESVLAGKQTFSEDFKLRPAFFTDLDRLFYICRRCFPENYRWSSLMPIGKNWWKVVLKSQSTQTWVAEDHSGIYAFCLLVIDSELWKKENKRRSGPYIFRVLSVLSCPVLAVWTRLWRIALVRLADRRQREYSAASQNFERTAWIELIAVLPHRRNQGCGAWLLQNCEEKALLNGATGIELRVDAQNTSARRMYERVGYVLSSERSGGCLYRKTG